MKLTQILISAILFTLLVGNSAFSQLNCFEQCQENPTVILAQANVDAAQAAFDANQSNPNSTQASDEYALFFLNYNLISLWAYELSCVQRCNGTQLSAEECAGYYERLYSDLVLPLEFGDNISGQHYSDLNALLHFYLETWFGCTPPWEG